MKKTLTKIIACILSVSILCCFSSVVVFADNSASLADSPQSIANTITTIVNFINDIIKSIKLLFGIDDSEQPSVPEEKGYADVKEFGAYGDGVHDDAAAIQKALDSLKNNGGTIYFPEGIYCISNCLIFYSNQHLDFENGAVIKRMALNNEKEPIELRYLLASYTSAKLSEGRYNGTHDVVISGATFDGNEEITTDSKITLFNLCHTSNVKITGCSFVNGSLWHYIECNSSKDVLIDNCKFDATTYVEMREDANEIIQIDGAKDGLYGPVYLANGKEMKFVKDNTPCVNIEISNCEFICNGFAAIGCHKDFRHSNILIHDNVFKGEGEDSQYIRFTESVVGVTEYNNIYE